MIPVYNCHGYLRLALESVLRQAEDESVMQIEVIDDCSSDGDVAALVREIGKGRVGYFCQPENMGSLRNFQTCLDRSRGQLVHILHGDDIVRPGFYKKMAELFSRHPDAGAAFCRYAYIDESGRLLYHQDPEARADGVPDNWLQRLCERQRIQYVAMVVKRDVYEHLGGFYGVEYGEDWEMWVRISANYPIGYWPEVLAEYRKHSASISGRSALTGKNMADLNAVIENIKQYLPSEKRETVVSRSKKFYAHYALRTANAIWKHSRRPDGAKAQLSAAWKMHRDLGLFYKSFKLYTKLILNL